ncbi:MAG: hypothetical protein ACRYFK_19070 [Janthinobacterium lividum]
MAPYPKGLGHYINASFEVLKAEQERLLSTHGKLLTEKEIETTIKQGIWKKEGYWGAREHEARAAAGQHYMYKPVSQPAIVTQTTGLIAWWRRI